VLEEVAVLDEPRRPQAREQLVARRERRSALEQQLQQLRRAPLQRDGLAVEEQLARGQLETETAEAVGRHGAISRQVGRTIRTVRARSPARLRFA
jgi:hypothetical protein